MAKPVVSIINEANELLSNLKEYFNVSVYDNLDMLIDKLKEYADIPEPNISPAPTDNTNGRNNTEINQEISKNAELNKLMYIQKNDDSVFCGNSKNDAVNFLNHVLNSTNLKEMINFLNSASFNNSASYLRKIKSFSGEIQNKLHSIENDSEEKFYSKTIADFLVNKINIMLREVYLPVSNRFLKQASPSKEYRDFILLICCFLKEIGVFSPMEIMIGKDYYEQKDSSDSASAVFSDYHTISLYIIPDDRYDSTIIKINPPAYLIKYISEFGQEKIIPIKGEIYVGTPPEKKRSGAE